MSDDSTTDFIYEEIRNRLERQEQKLDELRSRGALALGVGAVAVSVFADSVVSSWGIAAFILLSLGFAAVLRIYWPSSGWRFSHNPRQLRDGYLDVPLEEAKKTLMDRMIVWVEANEKMIDCLYGWLIVVIVSVGGAVLMMVIGSIG